VFYSMLIRIFKHVTLPLKGILHPTTSFSSYPGQVVSADVYDTLGTEMVVMETSDNIFNTTLYDYVVPQSLLSWQRTALANRLAGSGGEWSKVFALYNSGTYNNQWIIVDYKRTGKKDGLLWIAEQIPGKVASADMTSWLLAQSYWASYNIPYFPDIYQQSGYLEMEKIHGSEFSWDKCPRALLFRRNESLVTDLSHLQSLMTYNNYEHDPLENDNPMWAISSRGDLTQSNPTPFGGLDSKVTSSSMHGDTHAICGPSHVDLAPFSWTGKFPTWPHFGQPDVWDFKWELMKAPH